MTHEEQRIWLIRALLAEEPRYRHVPVPEDAGEQRDLLRSLMNVRPPRPVSGEFFQIQDAYLGAERDRRGVVDGDQLPAVPGDPRIALWQGDITTLRVDAIVNAANSALLGCFYPLHGCIDNIIHSRSGVQLRLACHDIMAAQGHEEPTGGAKITPAFNLPCRYVLHTVGPIITGRGLLLHLHGGIPLPQPGGGGGRGGDRAGLPERGRQDPPGHIRRVQGPGPGDLPGASGGVGRSL